MKPSTAVRPAPLIHGVSQVMLHNTDLLGCLDDLIQDLEKGSAADSTLASPSVRIRQLFETLQHKDAATASHSLRTTLGCAIWADRLKLSPEERDSIEAAALVHDIGKLVVPAHILKKPGPLDPEERKLLDLCRTVGLEVVRQKIVLPGVLEIATMAPAWYDGSRNSNGRAQADLPLGARMLAIIDALDAMTSDQVYRSALTFDEAFDELRRCAGRQFDPKLVQHLCALPKDDLFQWQEMIRRHARHDEPPALLTRAANTPEPRRTPLPVELFQQEILSNLRDGVAFVDSGLRIAYWNRSAARLTGVSAQTAYLSTWSVGLVGMRDGRGVRLTSADCPVAYALASGKQWFRRVLFRDEAGEPTTADVQVTPITSSGGTTHGVTILMRDLAPELSLRDRCLSLQQLITRDGLTQVANRAEFDRAHSQAVANHTELGTPYSLILCDIDHFKQVNDKFGHPAGDEILKFFSQLLERSCRRGDLVARYGGEEFAIVCSDCDLSTAARRAEVMRRELAAVPQMVLGGRTVTASFGVTTMQPGDTPAKMLGRADKALYQAKDRGRNAVVSIGNSARGKRPPSRDDLGPPLIEQEMVVKVPLPVAVEKLRGFIADHHAEILSIAETRVELRLNAAAIRQARRFYDRRLDCYLHLEMQSREEEAATRRTASNVSCTVLKVAIGPLRARDRRRSNANELSRDLMACFRSYMMITADDASERTISAG